MENSTSTYRQMYEGSINIIFPEPDRAPETDYSSVYYYGNIGFDFSVTHKLAQDRPTAVISIPCGELGIETPGKEVEKASADFCLRRFCGYIDELNAELYNRSRPDSENGKYYLYSPGGEVLRRNSSFFAVLPPRDYENGSGSTVYLLPEGTAGPPRTCLCFRMMIQLPKGKLKRTIRMLCNDLPHTVERFVAEFDAAGYNGAIDLAKKQSEIRKRIKNSEYCAFIANGSILPRISGTDLPLPGAVPFTSVPGDETEIAGVRGMGIRRGVTVITGGGYSGKSTLLDALSAGIYDHAPGDGRELCITDGSAVTVSAEDGRSVKHINISPFIKWLPGGDTGDFSTDNASGSTSQAANIAEAVGDGAKLLLIDEDLSATNFMIWDRVMKKLIEKEPITPFTDRVRELYESLGVSTILVIGGSGEYLSVADRVYMMEDFLIHDVTGKAKAAGDSRSDFPSPADWSQSRTLRSGKFNAYPEGKSSEKLEISDAGFIFIGDEMIDVRGLHNIVSSAQINALGFMLRYLEVSNGDPVIDIEEKTDALYRKIEEEGLDFLYSGFFVTCERFLDLPRKVELKALINRMKKIDLEKTNG